MPTSMASRVFVLLRAALYSAGFVFLWWWLAVQVRPYDSRLTFTRLRCIFGEAWPGGCLIMSAREKWRKNV